MLSFWRHGNLVIFVIALQIPLKSWKSGLNAHLNYTYHNSRSLYTFDHVLQQTSIKHVL
jgi:hypothetical protein